MRLRYREDYAFRVNIREGGVGIEWNVSVPSLKDPSKTDYEHFFDARASSLPDGTPPDAKTVQALFAQAAAAVLAVLAVDAAMAKDPEGVPAELLHEDPLHRLIAKAHMDHINKVP